MQRAHLVKKRNGAEAVTGLALADEKPFRRANAGCEWLQHDGLFEAASHEIHNVGSEHCHAVI